MTEWRVSGRYYEVCNCEAICPCIVFSPPSSGECIAAIVWKLDQGYYGDTDLSRLCVALIANAKGNMKDGNWRVALYTDQAANDDQAEALAAIFSGQAGGHLANLVPLIGEVLGVKPARIDLQDVDGRVALSIGDGIRARFEPIEGQEGGPVTVAGHPLAPVPGVAFTVGRSERFEFDDYGLRADLSGKNAFTTAFEYRP